MPSPFPGMDPYLEGSLWATAHPQLSVEIARQLAPKLRPKYVALPNERFVVDVPEALTIATAYPDVAVTSRHTALENGGTPVATAPLLLSTLVPERMPQVAVEIRNAATRILVTAIEVLSPTNKRGEGYDEYVARRNRFLMSTAHLMEIDLLRRGKRVPMREPLPNAAYFVFLSRSHNRPLTEVWPVELGARLPSVSVPLLPEDADVTLDLQLALNTVYDSVGYDLAVDYSQPPDVPLPDEAQLWARECLRLWQQPP